jgi:hypothetical protein
MEPHREGQQKAPEPSVAPKPKRFRIIKLEERIAPSKGGNGTHNGCGATAGCTVYCSQSCAGTCACTTTSFCDPAY